MTIPLDVLNESETHPLEPLSPEEIRRAVATVRERRGPVAARPVRGGDAARAGQGGGPAPTRGVPGPARQRHGAGVRGGRRSRRRAGCRRSSRCRRASSRRSCSTSSSSARRRSSESPEFLAALKKRGVEDVGLVMVDPWSAGVYGNETAGRPGPAAVAGACAGSAPSRWTTATPGRIEGVVAVVDLNAMEVLRVEDYGVVPAAAASRATGRASTSRRSRGDLKPLEIVQPEGPSFTVEGHEIRWQKWRFRIGFNPREGLVLHTITLSRPAAASGRCSIGRRSSRWSCPTPTPASSPTARTPSTSASTASACWPTR